MTEIQKEAHRLTEDLQKLNDSAKDKLAELKEKTKDTDLQNKLNNLDTRKGLIELIDEETKKNPQHAHSAALSSLKAEVENSADFVERVVNRAVDVSGNIVSTVGSAVGTAATTVNDVGVATTNALADRALPKDYANAVKELPDYAKVPLLGGAIYVTAKAVKWMFEAVGWEKGAEHVDKWGAGLGKWIGIIGVGLGIKNFVSPKEGDSPTSIRQPTVVKITLNEEQEEFTKKFEELMKLSLPISVDKKEEIKSLMDQYRKKSQEERENIMFVFSQNNPTSNFLAQLNKVSTSFDMKTKNFESGWGHAANTLLFNAGLTAAGLSPEDGKLLAETYITMKKRTSTLRSKISN